MFLYHPIFAELVSKSIDARWENSDNDSDSYIELRISVDDVVPMEWVGA